MLFLHTLLEWKRLPKYWMWPRLVGLTLSNLTMLDLPERKMMAQKSLRTSSGSLTSTHGSLLRQLRELAAFYTAVVGRYGPEEARRAAYDWIEEMETMDWPADWALPNWRHVTIAAADCLALRIIDRSPGR